MLVAFPKPSAASARSPDAASLARVELFRDLPAAELRALARTMRVVVVQAGREILLQGASDGGAVCFVLSGRVREAVLSEDGQLVRLSEFAAGDAFGVVAAIDGGPRPAGVAALTIARLAVMGRADFLDAVTRSATLSLELMRILARRSRRQDARLVELVTCGLAQRVAAELIRRVGDDPAVPACIDPAPRQADIAETVGARRESVARELGVLARLGLVARVGTRLLIRDPAALAERACAGLLTGARRCGGGA